MSLFQPKSLKLLSILLPLLILSGCKNKVVHVNTFADLAKIPYGLPKGSRIHVHNKQNSLLAQEVKIKLHILLNEKSYTYK